MAPTGWNPPYAQLGHRNGPGPPPLPSKYDGYNSYSKHESGTLGQKLRTCGEIQEQDGNPGQHKLLSTSTARPGTLGRPL